MTVSDFYKSLFGTKTYKISLNAGCTCPNRDGTISTGGCRFCNGAGSGDFAADGPTVKQQIEKAKLQVAAKLKGQPAKYIAYFQSFTNTYGDLATLSEKWQAAIACQDVVGIAIGTRPDCLSDECLAVLAELANKSFVQLELGLQTADDKTAGFLNRGYRSEVYREAVARIHAANPKIHVVTHLIFGLPRGLSPLKTESPRGLSPLTQFDLESKDQMLNSVIYALTAGTDGIKITSLYVVKGSAMEKDYTDGKLKVLEKDEYFSLIEAAVKIIPENIVIHRLTGDPPKRDLIAPDWTTDKKRVLNNLKKIL